jgi:hypothetical protein
LALTIIDEHPIKEFQGVVFSVVRPSEELIKEGDLNNSKRFNGIIERIAEASTDVPRVFVRGTADQVEIARQQPRARDVRREFLEPIEEDGGVAVVGRPIHICDSKLLIGRGGAEHRGEGMATRDEGGEGGVRVPSSEHPGMRAIGVGGMVGVSIFGREEGSCCESVNVAQLRLLEADNRWVSRGKSVFNDTAFVQIA